VEEVVFIVSLCEESGTLVASWDQPGGGGISTQGASLEELWANIREAVACHFDD
jgi:predicted RNase H-like HicB family nuclease